MRKNIKNKNLILLDLFSGMGGFHTGLVDAGLNISEVYYSEIDKHAVANYKYNFPNATYIGAVESVRTSGIKQPNIITFGSPCQDFSLAGKRAGLDGERSSLIQEAIATIAHFRPDIFIWENVKGAFSSNSRQDFWAIIQAFTNIGGYGLEWQLVNTSWLLPQNRERIYLIGHLTTSFNSWRRVFPIGKTDCNAIEISEGCSPHITSRTVMAQYAKNPTDGQYVQLFPSDHKKIIQVNTNKEWTRSVRQQDRVYSDQGIMACIPAQRTDDKINVLTTAQAVLTPDRINKRQNGRRFKNENEPSFTLTAQDRHGVYDGQRIRKLTEMECERLQGYKDNWTKYGDYDGVIKEIAKTHRYTLCGNAVSRCMVETIGTKISNNFL